MPIDHSYDPRSGTVRATASGVVTMAELLNYLGAVVGNPEIRPGFVELVDFTDIDDMELRYSEVQPLREIWRDYLEKGCAATVVVAPGTATFGIVRMIQTVLEIDADGAGRFIPVRSLDEALAAIERIPRD